MLETLPATIDIYIEKLFEGLCAEKVPLMRVGALLGINPSHFILLIGFSYAPRHAKLIQQNASRA